MLLHYLGKIKIQMLMFCLYSAKWKKMQTNCILIAFKFICPQILILSVFKIASLSAY